MSAPSPSAPPGVDATRRPRRRGLLLPAIAFGCAMLLLLGIGGGLTALWLTGRDDQPSPAADSSSEAESPSVEPGTWQPLGDGQAPPGSAEELEQVLASNPLLDAGLPSPEECPLPETEGGAVPAEELTDLLEAGAACLATAWTDALAPAGIDFAPPAVVVFTTEDLPADAGCEPERFSDSAPVVRRADNTLYWPALWDPGFSHPAAEEAPQLYMWHLSYAYALFALSAASLAGGYGALQARPFGPRLLPHLCRGGAAAVHVAPVVLVHDVRALRGVAGRLLRRAAGGAGGGSRPGRRGAAPLGAADLLPLLRRDLPDAARRAPRRAGRGVRDLGRGAGLPGHGRGALPRGPRGLGGHRS